MAGILDKAIGISIGLLILFLLGSTLIMPQFSTAWRYCQAKTWVGAHGAVYTNCTTRYQDSNTTAVSGTSHTESGETNPVTADNAKADQFCLNCATLGGYRITNQGLLLLVLVLALISFGLWFFPKYR